MAITQKEIARAAGVSPASVSLVLRGKPNRLSQESRAKILAKASELRYQAAPKVRKVSAAGGCIGLIVPNIFNYFFAEIVQGVSDCVQKKGKKLLLCTTDGSEDADRRAIRSMEGAAVSALLITASEDCGTAMFRGLHCPVVQVDRQSPALGFSSVILNSRKGGFLATQHLLSLGHRKLACLSGPRQLVSARERLEGFFWAMRDQGLPRSEDDVLEGDYQYQSGYALADRVLDGGYTAVVCGNDVMAFGLMKRCSERGVRIPADLSVVGFDNLQFSSLITPALTTVSQSGFTIGYRACQIAFQELENPGATRQTVLLEPGLVIRGSTAFLGGTHES
ncbi:MAG: LacI family transcriptional regulator [Oscillibacter sp.]|jgi:LacI family transcriptional regulator|nr:LacI family transcriptional regulator [Oscillibacter sp.]